MSKEVFIALIQKDIRELDMIAQGLYETEFPSPTIIKLAACKAQDVISNLQKLAEAKQAEPKTMATATEMPVQVIEVEQEISIKAEPKLEEATLPEAVVEIIPEAAPSIVLEVIPEIIPEEEITPEPIEEEIPTIETPVVEETPLEDSKIEPTTIIEEPIIEQVIEEPVAIVKEIQVEIEEEEEEATETEILEIEIESEDNTSTEIETLSAVETELEEIQEQLAETSTVLKGILSRSKEKGFVGSLFNKKIESIRKSISMGDRFRFQRDLFGNNIETMNKTIDMLDSFTSLEEAEKYITSNFNWDPEKETVADFLNIVSRKF